MPQMPIATQGNHANVGQAASPRIQGANETGHANSGLRGNAPTANG